MRTSFIGSLEVSVIGLGCNNFGRALDRGDSVALVHEALEAGITFFDTSDNYGQGRSESYLGAGLGSRRSDVVIATKFGMPVDGVEGSGGASAPYIRKAVLRSLSQLETDYIDLYQLHVPDPMTPIAETLGAMWELIDEGIVREIGCTNLSPSQLSEAIDLSAAENGRTFISDQIEYSLLHREPQTNGLRRLAMDIGVALLPFYPLANGLLTGKVRRDVQPDGRLAMDRYQSYLVERNFAIVDQLRSFVVERTVSMPQVALGWLLAQPDVPAVTPGATKPEQIRSNVTAADWPPSPEDLRILDAIGDT